MKKKKPDVRAPLIEALSKSLMLRFLGKSDRRGQELRAMLESGEVHEFAAGQTIITQGDASDAMYVLASGAVSVSLGGDEVCVMNQPGEVFGEFGLLTGELRSATVTAVQDATCFAVSSRFTSKAAAESAVFQGLMQQAVLKILLARLRQSNEEKIELKKALKTAENQVAFLRIDNDTLNKELDSARSQIREGLRGTRGSAGSA